MAYKPVEIDNSDIPQPVLVDVTRWEPPRHVYFGPRDAATGRMAKEPPKSTAMYPSTRYTMLADGRLRAKHVATAEEDAALDPDQWRHSPADWGLTTHPTRDQLRAMETEEKRGPGRPRKEAA